MNREEQLVECIKNLEMQISTLYMERRNNKKTIALLQKCLRLQENNTDKAWKRGEKGTQPKERQKILTGFSEDNVDMSLKGSDRKTQLEVRKSRIAGLIAELDEEILDIDNHMQEYHKGRLHVISCYEEETGKLWMNR